jgi:hypothetical protein
MPTNYFTVSDIARMYGVTRGTITAYKARGHMPPPDMQIGRTPVWTLETLTAWRPIAGRKTRKGSTDVSN